MSLCPLGNYDGHFSQFSVCLIDQSINQKNNLQVVDNGHQLQTSYYPVIWIRINESIMFILHNFIFILKYARYSYFPTLQSNLFPSNWQSVNQWIYILIKEFIQKLRHCIHTCLTKLIIIWHVICNTSTRLHCCICYVGEHQFVFRCYFLLNAGRQQHHNCIKVKQQW